MSDARPTYPSISEVLHASPGAKALTRLSAVDTVRARIRLSIESGLLSPGTKLPHLEDIAVGLEVSKATARRALEQLVEEDVLVRKRGRYGGTFVAENLPEETGDATAAYHSAASAIRLLIDQRSLMESTIMLAAAQHASEADCHKLEQLTKQSERSRTWYEHHAYDVKFHRHCANMSQLQETDAYLKTYHSLHKYFVPYPMEKIQPRLDEHRELIEAFRTNDSLKAVEITQAHVGVLREEMFIGLTKPQE
ncbi:hypothetical protein GCM10009720_03300 [Yaniella flava]|uniref:HTH gntR-type domain-containing protein n=1 Tax=Yaniella flava TaxID=287930 RepID=A0ABN2U282_9MICC|nr:FadR family transcriptional regulator [Micrococcaceae bacterium]